MFDDFQGEAKRLDDIDLPIIGFRAKVGEDEIHALMDVEAANSGFDRHGRPAMLFEPHLFYRELGPGPDRDLAVERGLAYPNWKPGNYPSDSYPRLKEAMEVNVAAALKSCSWGLGQILGSNHLMAGYRTVHDMVKAFMADEEEHLEAMIRFIIDAGVADALRRHNWREVARAYNGPSYEVHGYHTRLEAAYRKWAGIKDTPWEPARGDVEPANGEELASVQRRLKELAYTEVGRVDGKWGTKTRAGVLAFRADNGLPIYAGIDDEFMAALVKAKPRDIAPERKAATAEDLRREGSRTIERTDKASGAAVVAAGAGGLGGLVQAVDSLGGHLSSAQGVLDQIDPLKDAMLAAGPWVLGAMAIYVGWQVWQIRETRVEDHRTGKSAAPGGAR